MAAETMGWLAWFLRELSCEQSIMIEVLSLALRASSTVFCTLSSS